MQRRLEASEHRGQGAGGAWISGKLADGGSRLHEIATAVVELVVGRPRGRATRRPWGAWPEGWSALGSNAMRLLPADAPDAHPIVLAGVGGWSAARLHMQ